MFKINALLNTPINLDYYKIFVKKNTNRYFKKHLGFTYSLTKNGAPFLCKKRYEERKTNFVICVNFAQITVHNPKKLFTFMLQNDLLCSIIKKEDIDLYDVNIKN